jgi:hypothetical protein
MKDERLESGVVHLCTVRDLRDWKEVGSPDGEPA